MAIEVAELVMGIGKATRVVGWWMHDFKEADYVGWPTSTVGVDVARRKISRATILLR